MKKIISILFAAILLFVFSVPLFAQGTVWYYSDDLSIAVPVADDTALLTRNMSSDDPFLAKTGQTREIILASFIQNNVYLQLWKTDLSSVISISMTDSDFNDMNNFKEADWGNFISSIYNEFDYADVSEIVIFPSPDRTYAQFTIFANNGVSDIYSYYYVTIYQGKKIVIQLYAQNGDPSENQIEAFNSFAEDIYFGTEEEIFGGSFQYADSSSNAPLIYTDKPVNTSFTVPANWSPEPVTGMDPYVTAVFVLNTDNDMAIVYGSEDQWAKKFKSLGGGITRADINNDYFTEAEIEGAFDFPTSVGVKYVDDVKYFYFNTRSGDRVSTSMIMYHNAVFYWFEFYGDESNPYYDDFLSLLKSVKYPAVSAPASPQSTPASSQSTSVASKSSSLQSSVQSVFAPSATNSTQSMPAPSQSVSAIADEEEGSPIAAIRNFNTKHVGLYIALAVVLFALPILIYRYVVRKQPVDPKRAMEIVLIYGAVSLAALAAIAAFLEGSWVAVGIVLIWHIASYFILISGREQTVFNSCIETAPMENRYQLAPTLQWQPTINDEKPKPAEETGVNSKQPLFCEICGSRLKEESKFCSQCGATVVPLREEK